MKHLQLFEAYGLALAKPLIKSWKESGAEERYDKMFGKSVYRIYLPFTPTQEDRENFAGETFINGEVLRVLRSQGYMVTNYIEGTAMKLGDQKNIFKIGKLLQRFDPKLKQDYDADPFRAGKRMLEMPLMIVVSRHAYDIGGMSTGRGWKSCMNLVDGSNSHRVEQDVREGSIVAYVVRQGDKNIKAPISRLLMKPYRQEAAGQSYFQLATDKKMYGFNIDSFRVVMDDWLKTVNEEPNIGIYKLPSNLYDDGRKEVTHAPKGYTIENTFKNGASVIKNDNNGHFRLISHTGNLLTGMKEYSSLIQVEVEPHIARMTGWGEHYSLFFYAKEGNTNKSKRANDLMIDILGAHGKVLLSGDLRNDYDLLYSYLQVSNVQEEMFFIDGLKETVTPIKQCTNNVTWSVYEAAETKEFFLVNKAKRTTYRINDIKVKIPDLLILKEIDDSRLLIRFKSDRYLLLTIVDGVVETEVIADYLDTLNFDAQAPNLLKLNEDEDGEDMYAVTFDGGLKKFSLGNKEPELTIEVVRKGVRDVIVALDTGGFYSVRRDEFMFGDIPFLRYDMQNKTALVALKKGGFFGIVNVFTGKVLVPLNPDCLNATTAHVSYVKKLGLPIEENVMVYTDKSSGNLVRMLVDERGKMTPRSEVEGVRDDFPPVNIPRMPF